jgi:hypothetical protein
MRFKNIFGNNLSRKIFLDFFFCTLSHMHFVQTLINIEFCCNSQVWFRMCLWCVCVLRNTVVQ